MLGRLLRLEARVQAARDVLMELLEFGLASRVARSDCLEKRLSEGAFEVLNTT